MRTVIVALLLFSGGCLWADTGGSISGTVKDSTGAVIPDTAVIARNADGGVQQTLNTNAAGFYAFTALPVGHYEIEAFRPGFKPYKRTGLVIDIGTALQVDLTMEIGEESQQMTVTASATTMETTPETISTNLGEVVQAAQVQAIPLNGRSYTDLLAIQPGVSPVTTQTPTSVIMAGVTGTINPSGDLNPGNVSINGQRESANGFMVNGTDVQEHMNGGTSVIPNLDSIDEFRVLTNNFDPEYGNYNGGMIIVVTKSGSNNFHGDAFEFLRNTSLDARNFFDTTRGSYQQNQFGGTLGGPIKKDKIFVFLDYQGTRTIEGITSPLTNVLSMQERGIGQPNGAANFGDVLDPNGHTDPFYETASLNGQSVIEPAVVGGSAGPGGLASLLSSELNNQPITSTEPFYYYQGELMPSATALSQTYGSTCVSTAQCVFPNLTIPQSAWSAPGRNLLPYIPQPNNGPNAFETSSFSETVRDDKAGSRVDANTRWGNVSAYYFIDDYDLDNPYPGGQGGASVPGFDALSIGRAQEFTIGDAKVLGSNTVNEFRVGYLRNSNIVGQPKGGAGVSLPSQGFVTGPGTQGIVVQAPQFEGVENIVFPSFVMGVPITNVIQWNNTLYLSDSVSKVVGTHTLKFGGQFHDDQVNENPNGTFNGTFSFEGTETGNPFADFLLGFPSNYTQTTGQHFYLRNKYVAGFAEDSWRARRNLTLNYGLRWDLIEPWSEKYNNIQTVVPGQQSKLYPNAIPGLLVPGDPGIPSTLSPPQYHNFAPRIGVAYSPSFKRGFLKAVFGEGGQSSIRASFGQFYTAFPGLSVGIMYGIPPFGYNYLSPAPPLFATPFTNAGDGTQNTNPFPFVFPPHNVSQSNPYTLFNWAAVTPISAAPYFFYRDQTPYTEDYMLSFQRQITSKALLTISYAGNQGHHLLALLPTNPGNSTLCQSLSQSSQVAPGSLTCGPFGEDGTYTSASGTTYVGTRNLPGDLGSNYGATTAQKTIGNSNYNSLETTLRFAPSAGSTVLIGYTYSKSIDQASQYGEQLNPFNQGLTRAISAWDMKHNFVATYNYVLPFDHYFRRSRLTEGWVVSGTTRFATGLPVTLIDSSDNSLLGTLGNGVNNLLLDTPQMSAGPLEINTNPRNGKPAFNTSLFAPEAVGVLGNASRRFFYGPGISNFDLQVKKTLRLTESKSMDFRVQAFNVFNHAQFYGPQAVDGVVNDPDFGQVVSAAAPRLIQLAAKFYF